VHHDTDISIVIVNWNRVNEIIRNLHYLRFQKDVRFEVIVVDNGSTDASVDMLARIDGITLITLPSNVGPCSARNTAVERSRGRYILFLDSDSVISKWKLARLVERLDQDPTIGVLACRIIDGPTRRIAHWIYSQPAATFQLREFDTYSFSAAGAVIRAEAIRTAGLFWDELFIYTEEVDLSIRVLRAGLRIVYFPGVRVYHWPATSGRKTTADYFRLQVRNWIWICYRYYPPLACISRICLFIALYLLKATVERHPIACLSGIKEGLWKTEIIKRFPDKLTWPERRRIGALNARRRIRFGR
jgi:GT2 family glycosyltransferase